MNLMEQTAENTELFWQLYLVSCETTKTQPSLSDFTMWWAEEYGDDTEQEPLAD